MRRDRAKAEDYARRHNVPRVHDARRRAHRRSRRRRRLRRDAAVEPLRARAQGRGGGQAVPGREADGHESRRVPSDGRGVSRAQRAAVGGVLPARAAAVPATCGSCCAAGAIGQLTSVHVEVTDRSHRRARANWRFDPAISGAGLFLDLASHYFDIIDFLAGPITGVAGFPMNTGGAYRRRRRHRRGVSNRRQSGRHRRLELQRADVGRHHDVHRIARGARDRRSRRRGCDRHPGGRAQRVSRSAIRRTCTSR